MTKQQKLIKARHFQRGDIQEFNPRHWRVVDKKVWIEIPSKAENTPLPEVAADIQQRAQPPKEQQPKQRGRPAKTDTL